VPGPEKVPPMAVLLALLMINVKNRFLSRCRCIYDSEYAIEGIGTVALLKIVDFHVPAGILGQLIG
jgi:hypothetical protein